MFQNSETSVLLDKNCAKVKWKKEFEIITPRSHTT